MLAVCAGGRRVQLPVATFLFFRDAFFVSLKKSSRSWAEELQLRPLVNMAGLSSLSSTLWESLVWPLLDSRPELRKGWREGQERHITSGNRRNIFEWQKKLLRDGKRDRGGEGGG